MGRLRPQSCIALIATLAMLAGRGAHAQYSVLLDPSARAGGMGGAASAVAWGGTPDLWANPALVTAAPGFGVQVTSEQLVPGLAPDLYFRTTRFTAACAGLGISSAGRPLGNIDLDYSGMDELYNSWATMNAGSERTWANSFGLSAASFADAVAGATGHRARFADWGDVAWGRQWNRVRSDGMLGVPLLSTYDEGWLLRLAPIDSRRHTSPSGGGVRIEFTYAHAERDAGRANSTVFDPFLPDGFEVLPLWHTRTDGGALRLAWFGPARGDAPGGAWADVFRGGIGPLVDLTLACDHERVWLGQDERTAMTNYVVSHYGAEATFVRALTARFGYVDDHDGAITKPTWGLGLCLPAGRHGEVRYDFASWPQSYPRRVFRHQVALRIDPLSRWFGLGGEAGEQP